MSGSGTTLDGVVARQRPDALGWRDLAYVGGEPVVRRTDLVGSVAASGPPVGRAGRLLLAFAHLSDLHVCDHQSPARVAFLDRYADPDWDEASRIGAVGAYRAHDMLTPHVVEAMARALDRFAVGAAPVTGGPISFAIVTGDLTDNAQTNELDWYLTLLDGGRVVPDSGDLTRYEGVASSGDVRYWHPDGEVDCVPRTLHGFPLVPGLLDAVRRPFDAAGLRLPWYAVNGNHDLLVQGTVPASWVPGAATGRRMLTGPPPGVDVLALLTALDAAERDAVVALAGAPWTEVSSDPLRRHLERAALVAAHLVSSGASTSAGPVGHGFGARNVADGTAYYAFDAGVGAEPVRCVVLDTVDPYGGWQGSLDDEQLAWLERELSDADADRRRAVLFSHHPLETLVNPMAPEGVHRVLADEVLTTLHRHPSVVAWFNGHTHAHTVTPFAGVAGGFWQVTTASHVDWPQQSRLCELSVREDGMLAISTTVVDHAGAVGWGGGTGDVLALAGLSRVLAANDWQFREHLGLGRRGAGEPADRNVELLLPDPW